MKFRLLPAAVLLLLSAGCGDKPGGGGADTGSAGDGGEDTPVCDPSVDRDCDNSPDDQDCLPDDPYSYPGAPEIPYDGVDNDCAGDGDLIDVDGDGYTGASAGGDDCNDNQPQINPDAEELCYDGIDQDCDGFPASPEDDTLDCDGDGHEGIGTEATDCDDSDASVNPDAEEIWYDGVDQDCDRESDYDADLDGDEAPHDEDGSEVGTDCDDSDALTNGLADERWDGVDRNCDDTVDNMGTFDATMDWYANTSSGDGWFGLSLVPLEDYDGDGIAEIGVGGPYSGDDGICEPGLASPVTTPCGGWFQILPGGGPDGTPGDVALGVVVGAAGADAETAGSWLGYEAASMGDLDGDGWSEVALGAPLHSKAGGTGAVLVFDGADLQAGGELQYGAALAIVSGDTYAGLDVAAGDVDGDGVADLAAGSSSARFGIGFGLAVWSGEDVAAGGSLTRSDALAQVDGSGIGGETVGGGDYDGDGLGDLIVALNTDGNGNVYVIPGADLTGGTTLSVSDYPTLAGTSGAGLGTHSAWLSDADGDGRNDVVLGAPWAEGGAESSGEVYVILGPDAFTAAGADDAAWLTLQGDTSFGGLVPSGDGGGDVDGDGRSDLLAAQIGGSVYGAITATGYGLLAADMETGTWLASDLGASFGARVPDDFLGVSSVVTDRDGDGDGDVYMAAPANNGVGMLLMFESGWAD